MNSGKSPWCLLGGLVQERPFGGKGGSYPPLKYIKIVNLFIYLDRI